MLSQSYILSIIAIIITFMFFVSGIDKLLHFNKVVSGFEKRFPTQMFPYFHELAILIALILEIVAPIVIVYSIYNKKYYTSAIVATIALIVFTIIATLIYHFPPFGNTYYPFISNITTLGGLFLLWLVIYVLKSCDIVQHKN